MNASHSLAAAVLLLLQLSCACALAHQPVPRAAGSAGPRGVKRLPNGGKVLPRRGLSSDPTALKYHGGPVFTGTVTVYLMYIGYTSEDREPAFLNYLTSSLETTSWWKVLTKYYSVDAKTKQKTYVSGKIKLGKAIYLPMSVMKSKFHNDLASDSAIPDIINEYLDQPNGVPYKPDNAIYVLIPNKHAGLKMGDFFCGQACGWHSYQDYYVDPNSDSSDTYRITYAYVPQQSQCPACVGDMTRAVGSNDRSPTGDINLDAMVDTLVHELAETVTDPDAVTGWYGKSIDEENGDVCTSQYTPLKTTTVDATDGSKIKVVYNQMVGGTPYVFQSMWRPDINPKTKKQFGCVTGLN